MNEDVNKRFVIRAEIVFTTQQEMDTSDAEYLFEQEISEYWDGLRDLDFESVRIESVGELPAGPEDYEDFKEEKRLQS